jgi:hypothetical protein
MFGGNWDKGDATIVARNAKFSGDGSSPSYEFIADVRPPNAAPFRATIKPPTIATDFWPPDVGAVVSVLIKAKDGKVKFDKDDARLSVKAYERARDEAFEATKRLPPEQ